MDVHTLARCLVIGIILTNFASVIVIYVWGVKEYGDWLWIFHE